MPSQILNSASHQSNSDIVPRHPRICLSVYGTLVIFLGIQDVSHSIITIVDSWPNITFHISELMLLRIVTTIAQVQAPHKAYFLINHNHLLVVSPHKWNQDIMRMQMHFNVLTQSCEIILGELRIDVQCNFRSIVDNDIYFNTCICDISEDDIQSKLVFIVRST